MYAKRSLGQHFMVDESILRREVEYAEIESGDTVLEVGPGTGNLTKYLVPVSGNLYVIEKDRMLASLIRQRFPGVNVLEGDALRVDWPDFDVMVSNIPYKISSPLTFRLLKHDFRTAVLTYQREFAERLVAGAGEPAYSRLSVMIHYRAEAELLEFIPKSAFRPMPKVESAVVRIRPRKKPPFSLKDEKMFDEVVRVLFASRRKTVRAALRKKYGIDDIEYGDMRAEELTPAEIAEIADTIAGRRSKVLRSIVENP